MSSSYSFRSRTRSTTKLLTLPVDKHDIAERKALILRIHRNGPTTSVVELYDQWLIDDTQLGGKKKYSVLCVRTQWTSVVFLFFICTSYFMIAVVNKCAPAASADTVHGDMLIDDTQLGGKKKYSVLCVRTRLYCINKKPNELRSFFYFLYVHPILW